MRTTLFIVLYFFSVNLFGQHIVRNTYFSITFPRQPDTYVYPGDTEGMIYQYTHKDEYTIQVIRMMIPAEYRSEIIDSDFESTAMMFLSGYLRTVGGGQQLSKESFQIENYKAIQYLYSLNSPSSLYKYARMVFCYTPNNIYSILFYHTNSNAAYNNYLRSFKILK